MRLKIAAALAAVVLLLSGGAVAQSGCPALTYGAVLTAGQWNACFAAKQDLSAGSSAITVGSTSIITGSANGILYDNSGKLGILASTGTTGAGNLVFSASPTFTGTVSGAATIWSGNSTAAAFIPSASTVPTNGMYLSAANAPAISSNGIKALSFDSSQNATLSANVGIGMTASNILDIRQNQNALSIAALHNNSSGTAARGAHELDNGTSQSYFVLNGASFTTSGIDRQDGTKIQAGGAGGLTLNTNTAQPIYLAINGAEAARFGTDGSLLIGTTTNAGAGVISAAGGALLGGALKYGGVTLSNSVAGTGSMALETDGNYTPTDQSGASLTFTNAEGHYRRVGNMVFFWGFVTYPVSGDTNQAAISLPFTSANIGTQANASVQTAHSVSTTPTVGFISPNTSKFVFGTVAAVAVSNAGIANGNVYFSGSFAAA